MLKKEQLELVLRKYPILSIILRAGVVSKKMTRELLELDKWLMDDVHKDLLLAGAIQGVSSGCFKATTECLEYLKERVT